MHLHEVTLIRRHKVQLQFSRHNPWVQPKGIDMALRPVKQPLSILAHIMEHPDNGFTRLRITLLLLLMSFYHSYTPFGKKKCLSGRQRPFSEDCLYFCFLFDSIFITFLFWIDRWAGVTGTESVAGGLYMAHGTTQGVTVLAGFSDSSCFHFASSSSFSVTARV